MDKIKGYKTILFFALTLLTALAGLFGFYDWQPTADQTELVTAIVAIAGIVLRWRTTTPLFRRQ